jgi:hypothetical protein
MREYKIYLKGEPAAEPILVRADDVNLVSADGPSTGAFFNFWQAGQDGAAEATVAAVPLDEVRYVVSQ